MLQNSITNETVRQAQGPNLGQTVTSY